MDQWRQGEILENYHWNERLCSLRIAVELPEFKAGQFIRIALPEGDEMLARAYSLVNAPHEPVAEIYFNRVPDGPLSSRLHQLTAGDTVFVSRAAAGFLTLAEVPECQHLWMLATGTAVGPFLSILKTDTPWRRFEKVILVHSVRSQDELTYRTWVNGWREQHPEQFVAVAAVTREQVPLALRQRIPEAIRTGALEAQAGVPLDPQRAHVLVCGSPEMVSETVTVLKEKGLRKHRRREPGHISVEIYK